MPNLCSFVRDALAKVHVVASLVLFGSLLSAPPAADAQQAGKLYRVGLLNAASSAINRPYTDMFLDELRVLGWQEGKNFVLVDRYADGKIERLTELAGELVAGNVDVILAPNHDGVVAARRATSTIPIVMMTPADPVGSGFVSSLARPGGNVTGTSLLVGPDVIGKHLDLLKQAIPQASQVTVLSNAANGSHPIQIKRLESVGHLLGVQIQPVAVRMPEELEGAFASMAGGKASALLVLADPIFFAHRQRIVELAARHKLPAMYVIQGHVQVGGLMEYSPDLIALIRRSAHYIDKILKGAKAESLPVEQPTTFALVVNLKAAKALGLTLPQSFLLRVDRVIE